MEKVERRDSYDDDNSTMMEGLLCARHHIQSFKASHAILTTTLDRCSDYPHFIGGQTEAQRSRNLLAKATQRYIVEQEFTSRLVQSLPSPHLPSRGNMRHSISVQTLRHHLLGAWQIQAHVLPPTLPALLVDTASRSQPLPSRPTGSLYSSIIKPLIADPLTVQRRAI